MRTITQERTKVIATIGPACNDGDSLRAFVHSGIDLIRFNASHNSDYAYLKPLVDTIRKHAEGQQRHIGLLMDLQGPKIRVGTFKKPETKIVDGQSFVLSMDKHEGDEQSAYVSYPTLVDDIKKGDPVYIDDGKIQLIVERVEKRSVLCNVTRGGILTNKKGVNLPRTRMSFSPFTSKDQADVLTAIKLGMDYLALSFVSDEQDIDELKAFLKQHNAEHIKVIAKIERQRAVDHLKSIIEKSDAVMVARGDLGVEVGVEKVPKLQKKIIRECNRRIKPVIVATQMLESMIQSETATRAEVSDVAYAVYEHCDSVMLSAETAVGINPPNAVSSMRSICLATDEHKMEMRQEYEYVLKNVFDSPSRATSFCTAANQIAEDTKSTAIMVFTSSGTTPLVASKLKSSFPIIAPTDQGYICRQMALFRGVTPMMMPKPFKQIENWTAMISMAVEEAKRLGFLETGDTIVVTAGIPLGQSNGINSIRIITV